MIRSCNGAYQNLVVSESNAIFNSFSSGSHCDSFRFAALCVANLNETTYFVACVIVPAMLALAFRYFQGSNHGVALPIAIVAAIVLSSSMLAYGSYDKNFNGNATGFLVGDGWNSVVASAIFGVLIGLFLRDFYSGLSTLLFPSCSIVLIANVAD